MSSSLQETPYHKTLRVALVVCTAVMVFDSGLMATATARLSDQTQMYLANAVGVYVGVPPNDTNLLTTRIAELEQEVGNKDAQLRERELSVGLGTNTTPTSTFILSGILFIMLVLIVLNYALDYVRSRQPYATSNPARTPLAQ